VILAETSVVEPDLAIIRQGRRGSLSKRGFEGAPDVVVEILSPTTRGNDVFLKKAAYARLGVAEYWIVDPDLGRIEVFRLKEGGYDQGLLFDRSATLSRPRFPRSLSRWRLFSRLCSREKRKNLENASSAELATWCATWSARAPGSCMRPCPRTIQSDGADPPW